MKFDTSVQRLRFQVDEAMPEDRPPLNHGKPYMVKPLSDNLCMVWTERGHFIGQYAMDRFS